MIRQSVQAHLTGHGLFLDREDTAKATAFIGSRQIDESQPVDGRKQLARRVRIARSTQFARCAEAKFAQRVTTRVQAHAIWKAPQALGGDIVGDKKLAEFECSTRHGCCAGSGHMIWKPLSDRRRAAAGKRHDLIEAFEDIEIVVEERLCGIRIARSQKSLSATGLSLGKDDIEAKGLENVDGRKTDFRFELIDITGNEKSDRHQEPVPRLRASEVRQRLAGMADEDMPVASGFVDPPAVLGRNWLEIEF